MFKQDKADVQREVRCPNCQAWPTDPCTVPKGNTRKRVTWLHAARYIAYDEMSDLGLR